jgi:hypothetical protein
MFEVMSTDGDITAMEHFAAMNPNYIPSLDGIEGDGVLEPPIAYHAWDLELMEAQVEELLW